MNAPDVIVQGDAAGFTQQIETGPHRFSADEPIEAGGKNSGPSPYDLLLAALGSCTSMTISLLRAIPKMAARKCDGEPQALKDPRSGLSRL